MKNINFNEIFEDLFFKAKEKDEVQFLTSLFAFYKYQKRNMLSYVLDEELQEVTEFISFFGTLINVNDDEPKNLTRTRILLYCHILEVDFIYLIINNLINTIGGENYSNKISTINKKGEVVLLEFPTHKIDLISKHSKKYGLKIHSIYEKIFFHQIRNAFSHSQYSLSPWGDFNISKFIYPSSDKVFKRPTYKTFFKFDEISALFDEVYSYLVSFIETYKKFIFEYKNDIPHLTLYGEIKYHKNRGWKFAKH